ncbi:O-antigen ligase family protein [Ignavibacterium sp.]|uniref:O-antigen ligase family protein n=1 Tax=Ignavibacterium sp. TaxID=2651167 RepID=UPI00307DDD7D
MYRDIFTISALLLLSFFFLKKFGLDINEYPKPPKLAKWLISIIFVTVLFSTSISGLNSESIGALFRTSIFFLIIYFYYAFIASKTGDSNVYYLLLGLFISSLVLSISVYYDFVRSSFALFIFDILITRWAGAFGNPNSLALVVSINIIFIIVLFYSVKVSRKIKLTILPILLLNFGIILFLTNSRAAILSLILSLIFLLYQLEKKIIIYLISLTFILFIIYLTTPFLQELVNIYLRLETVSQRDYLWKAGLDMVSDYPLFGVGPEQYPKYFYTYIPTSGSYFFNLYIILQKPHPHNYSLWMIAENGILGLVTALSIFGFYFYMSAKLIKWNRNNRDEKFLFAVGLFSVGILVFVRSFFEVEGIFSYGFISRDLPFWISYIILTFFYNQNLNELHLKNDT